MKAESRNIIQFVIDTSKNSQLASDFRDILKKSTSSKEIKNWFESNDYDITDEECIRLLENKHKFPDSGLVKEY